MDFQIIIGWLWHVIARHIQTPNVDIDAIPPPKVGKPWRGSSMLESFAAHDKLPGKITSLLHGTSTIDDMRMGI